MPEGGGGGGLVPVRGGRGLNVPLGGNLGRGESGGGLGSRFGVRFGFFSSIYRVRQYCRAETGRTTHWSGCDEGSRGDSNKDSEMHVGVLL